MSDAPVIAVAAVLAAAGIAPVQEGSVDEEPDACVFVLATGGLPPTPEQGSGLDWKEPTCQLVIRGAPRDKRGPHTRAHAVWTAVNKAPPADYIDMRPRESQPNYIGPDHKHRHQYTINVKLDILE